MYDYVLRNVRTGLSQLTAKKITLIPLIFLCVLLVLAVLGPMLAPYDYQERVYTEDGQLLRAESPSVAHPLGTTATGYDVLSRLIFGVRPTVITGLVGGSMILSIGLGIGVTAGYVGGWVDDLLMRITDVAYSIPLIPFAIVLMAFLGGDLLLSVFVVGILLWRSNARVLRSQVLQIRERPYVTAAKVLGASRLRIVTKHVLPNIAPMAILFFAMGMGWAIIVQASLAFIGVTNPFVPSWGIMIRNAYDSGYLATQWSWAIAPGLMISFTVLSAFLLGREYEMDDQQADQAMGVGG